MMKKQAIFLRNQELNFEEFQKLNEPCYITTANIFEKNDELTIMKSVSKEIEFDTVSNSVNVVFPALSKSSNKTINFKTKFRNGQISQDKILIISNYIPEDHQINLELTKMFFLKLPSILKNSIYGTDAQKSSMTMESVILNTLQALPEEFRNYKPFEKP